MAPLPVVNSTYYLVQHFGSIANACQGLNRSFTLAEADTACHLLEATHSQIHQELPIAEKADLASFFGRVQLPSI